MKSALGFATMIESLKFLMCTVLFWSSAFNLNAVLCLHRVSMLQCVVFLLYWLVFESAHAECDS
jgi:hypothetical protein